MFPTSQLLTAPDPSLLFVNMDKLMECKCRFVCQLTLIYNAHTGLNITTGGIQGVAGAFATPVAYGHFGTVVNTGNSSQPEANSITIEAEVQLLNSSRNRNGHVIGIRLQAYVEGVTHAQERSLSFKVGVLLVAWASFLYSFKIGSKVRFKQNLKSIRVVELSQKAIYFN